MKPEGYRPQQTEEADAVWCQLVAKVGGQSALDQLINSIPDLDLLTVLDEKQHHVILVPVAANYDARRAIQAMLALCFVAATDALYRVATKSDPRRN